MNVSKVGACAILQLCDALSVIIFGLFKAGYFYPEWLIMKRKMHLRLGVIK